MAFMDVKSGGIGFRAREFEAKLKPRELRAKNDPQRTTLRVSFAPNNFSLYIKFDSLK